MQVIERAAREILPVALRSDHPRSFAFIPCSPTWPGVLADFMAAGYNINQSTWLAASGPSQIELLVIGWFRRWLGYPENAGGLFTSGGLAASLDAFVAAEETAGRPDRATVYMNDQSHSAQVRSAMIIGVRPECIGKIPSDGRFRLEVEALAVSQELRGASSGYDLAGRPWCLVPSHVSLTRCNLKALREAWMIATDVFGTVTDKRGYLDGKPMTAIRWEKNRCVTPCRYHEHLLRQCLASGWDVAVPSFVSRVVPFTCSTRVGINGVLSFEFPLADLASDRVPPVSNARDRDPNQPGVLRARI
ncbi:MAG: pyridoxal-dependent decarboxylase [Bryobacterales bacterium]|nr:pyridoxal-dependent decarboxylase [Bryobacterales bacterium]